MSLVEKRFDLFLSQLEQLALLLMKGKIMDASFVEASRQRNSRDENKEIKGSKVPESISKNPRRKAQKDTDARWTKKNNENYFGYKNYVKTDAGSKIITKYIVTDASVHDSQARGENYWTKKIKRKCFTPIALTQESSF